MKDLEERYKLGVCLSCRTQMFYDPENKHLRGQVYSEDGIREVYISGFCETCFDTITDELEEWECDCCPRDVPQA